MIKSYTGVVSQEEQKLRTAEPISNYMTTKIIAFRPEQSIHEAIEILLKNRISGAPVVNEQNELVGVLSEGDCLKEIVKGKYHNHLARPGQVGDHMTTNVTTIEQNLTVLDAAHFFLNRRFRRFPVVNEGKLVGLLTQTDVLKAVDSL
ncbi:MAG: CBS domain-containing protein [Bacteroidia bacterium]|nr:CBS domain-containing protein [Bacteroidia bacterium]